jgi:hypothetical protein
MSDPDQYDEKRIYCKYCGGKLRYDKYGPYCLTENCQGNINSAKGNE